MFGAIPLWIRHRLAAYLRVTRSSQRALVLAGAVLVVAAAVPPATLLPKASAAALVMVRVWPYWCSMVLGAAPLLAAGALVAAIASGLPRRCHKAALVVASICLPGCDCSINASCGELARLPPALAAFAVTWGTCCNPVALTTTFFVLGPRVALSRALCGLTAALCTAAAWRRSPELPALPVCDRRSGFWERCAHAMAGGLSSFSMAAAIACVALGVRGASDFGSSELVAAALGAVLSPCSSSDALLARVLFTHVRSQLAFLIAAQCLDVRQVIMLLKNFGITRTLWSVLSSATACALGCALV